MRVEPATPQLWPDVVAAFGRRARDADSCWCQRFRQHDEVDNLTALHREIDEAEVPVGLLAYVDDAPVGWSRVVPRRSLPGVQGNRALRRILDEADDDSAWWVACVMVDARHRGAGVGLGLLRAAIDHARHHGASVLEGHPVDVAKLTSPPSPSAVFTGTLSMFRAAGFTEIGRTYPSRPVMRLSL